MSRIERIKGNLSDGVYEGNVYTNIADDIQHLLSKLEIAEKALEEIYDCGSRKQAEIISRDTLKKIRGEEE